MSKEFTKEDETSEALTMKGEAKGMDKEFWESMTTGQGPLVAGALPGMDVVSEQAMAELISGGSAAKAKAKKKLPKASKTQPYQCNQQRSKRITVLRSRLVLLLFLRLVIEPLQVYFLKT